MWKHLLHTIKYIKSLKIEEHANNGELTSGPFSAAISVFDHRLSFNKKVQSSKQIVFWNEALENYPLLWLPTNTKVVTLMWSANVMSKDTGEAFPFLSLWLFKLQC